jgi:iron complex outermembrane receptor protein
MFSGSYYNSDGQSSLYFPEFNSPSNNVNNGVARHTDYETFFKTFASVSWRDFTLEGTYSSREKGIPTGAYGVIFNDDRAKTRDDRGYLNLKFDHAFDDDLELSANAFYDHYFYQGDYPLDYGAYDVTYKDFARGDWWGLDAQVIRRFGERVTLTVGGEYHDNVRQDQESYDNEPRVVYFDDHRSTWNFGFYGQGEVAILTNLILNAGVRYDKFETFGDTVNPRVGLIYSPVEPTTFKAFTARPSRRPTPTSFTTPALTSRATWT